MRRSYLARSEAAAAVVAFAAEGVPSGLRALPPMSESLSGDDGLPPRLTLPPGEPVGCRYADGTSGDRFRLTLVEGDSGPAELRVEARSGERVVSCTAEAREVFRRDGVSLRRAISARAISELSDRSAMLLLPPPYGDETAPAAWFSFAAAAFRDGETPGDGLPVVETAGDAVGEVVAGEAADPKPVGLPVGAAGWRTRWRGVGTLNSTYRLRGWRCGV